MIRRFTRCILVLAAGTLGVGGQTVVVDRGVGIPGVWSADRPLYVKGDLGIPKERLDDFADWLTRHAPNWTIVLLRDANDERFRDAAGEEFAGMDAVEHALGKTLPTATAFADLIHPETGEKNGAYFILYLDERKLAYHASEAYDKRRLGEDHWIGNLDAAAIAAMRGGARVIDAAKDTVTRIDRELERRIRQEAEARAREAERTRRATEETAAAIAEARQRLTDLKARLRDLRRDFNNPPGDLANPPVLRWAADLDAAERALGLGDPNAADITRAATDEIARHLRALADHEAAPARIGGLGQEFDEVRLHEASGTARESLLAARDHLRAAEEAHTLADAGYARDIAAAETGLADALRADAATRGQVAELNQLRTRATVLNSSPEILQQIARAEASLAGGSDIRELLKHATDALDAADSARRRAVLRQKQRETGLAAGGGVLLLGLIITGVMGNRRRREPRARAMELFATWEATLRERSNGLFQLLDRSSATTGSAADLDRSGWTGETLRLSRQTLADVDHLFILASGIDRVLDQARELLFPRGVTAKSLNGLSRTRYDRALVLLEKQPIRFSPDDPLRTIFQGRELRNWQGLLGHGDDKKPFTHTFIELNEAFRERATRALASLEVLKTCWTGSQDAMSNLDSAITAAGNQECAVHEAATNDGHFPIPAVFEQLLPAAETDLELAASLAAGDPVSALRGELPRGQRRAADALAICEFVMTLRAKLLPKIESDAVVLTECGRGVGWIGEALDALSTRANELAATAVDHPISEALQTLAAAAESLALATTKAVRLDRRASDSCLPAMSEARSRIERERQRLGGLTGLPAEQLLREEPALDPSHALDQAARQHTAALAEIDLGELAAASNALDACDGHCKQIHELIDATLEAFESAATTSAELERETRRITDLLPAAAAVLEGLRTSWAPAALRPSSADPTYPDADTHVANHIQLAETHLSASSDAMTKAAEAHCSGRILQAAHLRQEAGVGHADAEEALRRIHAQAAAIDAAVSANRGRLSQLDHQLHHLERAAADPQITKPAHGELAVASDLLNAARTAVEARGASANPFEAGHLLDATTSALTATERRFALDRELHAEVARSLEAAAQQMNAARQLAHRSQTDNIPDSPETTRSLQQLAVLERELGAARQAFAVPHGDWQQLEQTADRITSEAIRLGGRLRGELELAEQAVQAIHSAQAKVRAASAWRGDCGSGLLQQARAGLGNGDYHTARNLAANASRVADQAVRAIEAEALMRLRQAQRQHEAARRRQMSRTTFGSSSGSASRTSGFGSRSSFSSRSGSSRSSFSSGSGTRRSGW